MERRSQSYYTKLFAKYPDLVTLPEFREMLGGIGDSTARKLMREKRLQFFYIRHTYLIPKSHVIEYVMSEHYAGYKEKLKVRV